MKISEVKLRIISDAMDKLIQWALNTLTRLTRSSNNLLMWLKSCRRDDPNRRPFRLPQEPTTVKRYVNHWKQFLFYVLHTSLLDESIREEMYGIHFTESQLAIIRQLLEMLKECDDDDEDGGDERCRVEEKEDDDADEEAEEDDIHQ